MSYTPYIWVDGELITAEKLNSLEENVAYAISTAGKASVVMGSGAPTSATRAEIGQLYADITNDYNLYLCINSASGGSTTWSQVIGRISSPEIQEILNGIE